MTTKTPSTKANEALGVTQSLTASDKPTKRTLMEAGSDIPAKKRPKMSEQNTFIEHTVNNTSRKATSDSNKGVLKDAGAPENISEAQLDHNETTLELLNKQPQATQRPSALEGLSASTTGSHSSDPSGHHNQDSASLPLPSPSPPPLPKVSSKMSNSKASREPSLSPNSAHVPWSWHYTLIRNGWVNKSGNGSFPRSKARSYRPARRSRGGPEGSDPFGCFSISPNMSATTEPKPKSEPLPLPLPSTKNSERSLVQIKAVPGTKAERLAEYMKYWQRPEKLEEEEENYDKEESKPKMRYNLRSSR